MAERKQYGRWSRDLDGTVGSVQFADKSVMKFDMEKLTEENYLKSVWFGVKQKLASDASDVDNLAEYKQVCETVWQRLCSGQWEAERTYVFQRAPIIEALKALMPKAKHAAIEAATDDELKEAAKKPQVQVEIKKQALAKAQEAAAKAEPLNLNF